MIDITACFVESKCGGILDAMKKWYFLLLLAILALGAFLRFYAITETPPGLYPDEAMNGNNALEALSTDRFRVFYPENNGREGLFINLQAISLAVFGNEPWALRGVAALFGTLTIVGIYLLSSELLKSRAAGLLSAFFLATSYWHVNFSRIGFRAILVPFFATFAMYFLFKGLRRDNILNLVLAGIFAGLGFHTYIAFRFMLFVFAVPIVWYLLQNQKSKIKNGAACVSCATVLFLFIAFVIALPLGVYFLQYPNDFLGRGSQVSIFSADAPLRELGKSSLSTVAMLFVKGDCNWRHNFNCKPQLDPLVAAFFIAGAVALTMRSGLIGGILFVSLVAMSLPAILTREGLPHALRAIGMLPPVMIMAGYGAWWSGTKVTAWLERQKIKWPEYARQLARIRRELIILFLVLLLTIPLATYQNYFLRWAGHPETYAAFSADLLHIGQFLNSLPRDIKKYVVINAAGTDVRGIPMPAQTVMFATDTFRGEERQEKNLFYLTRDETSRIELPDTERVLIAILDGGDRDLIRSLRQKFPALKVGAPDDFVVLQNY